MRTLFIVSWLVSLVIADNNLNLNARTYGCQLLPIVRGFSSRLYPQDCSLTVPTYVCAGFCESSVEPVKARRSREYDDVWQIQFKEDCGCCIPTNNRINTAVVKEWKLECLDGVDRNETVTLQWPSSCSCTQCRNSLRVG